MGSHGTYNIRPNSTYGSATNTGSSSLGAAGNLSSADDRRPTGYTEKLRSMWHITRQSSPRPLLGPVTPWGIAGDPAPRLVGMMLRERITVNVYCRLGRPPYGIAWAEGSLWEGYDCHFFMQVEMDA